MNAVERRKMVNAMEFIARNLNDESIFDVWLTLGVADGDIQYGSVDTEDENLDYYIEDRNFSYLMKIFVHMMGMADKSGGLYCDGVSSKE